MSTAENMADKGEARVVTSILTNKGVAEFRKLEKLPRGERIKAQQELLKNNPGFIAETVAAETDDKGRYFARFEKKDFDNEFLYQFVQVKRDGKWVTQPAYSSYPAPMFGDPTATMNIPQLWRDARHSWANMHFGLVSDPENTDLQIDEDVVYAGNKVTPKIQALLNGGEEAYIQWTDKNGKVVQVDGKDRIDVAPAGYNINNPFEAATLTVPDQATLTKSGNDTYTATLYVNGAPVAADSVAVSMNGPDSDAAKFSPKYETTYIQLIPDGNGGFKDTHIGTDCGPSTDNQEEIDNSGLSCANIRNIARIANIADIPKEKIKSVKVTGIEGESYFGTGAKLVKDQAGWAGGPRGGSHISDPRTSQDTTQEMKSLRAVAGLDEDRMESDIPVGIRMRNAEKGQVQNVKVRVTYADNSYDDIIARFVYGDETTRPSDEPTAEDRDKFDVSYKNTEAKPTEKASVQPKITTRDEAGNEKAAGAENVTKYEKAGSVEGIDDADWTVDETTGEVSWTPKEGTAPGSYTFPVKVTYKDGTTETTTATFTVKDDAKPVTKGLAYKKTTAPQGEETKVDVPTADGKTLEGASYTMTEADKAQFPWVTVNSDGSLTLNPTADTKEKKGTPKGTYYVPVMVKEANGGEQIVYAEVEVTDEIAKTEKPTVNAPVAGAKKITGTAEKGAEVTVTLPGNKKVKATADKDGNYSVDVPKGVTLKKDDTVTAVATSPNKKQSDPAEATVTANAAETYSPSYEDATGQAGTKKKVPVKTDKDLPKETTFEIPETAKIPEGWTVEVDPTTGEVSVTPKADIKTNTDATIPVTVKYPDGSSETINLKFTAKPKPVTPVEKTTEKPKVNAVTEGDTEITGKTEPNAKVVVELPDGTTATDKAGEDGTFTVKLPEGKTVPASGTVKTTATAPGKKVSEPTNTEITAKDTTTAPKVNPVKEGEDSISGEAEPGATVTVTLPDGTTATDKAGEDGKFTVKLPEGKTVPASGTVKTTATAPGKKVSEPTNTEITAKDTTTAPKVNPVKEGDDSISGEAEPGATVTVTLPDGTTATDKAGDDGKFSIPVDKSKLKEGDKITVVAEKEGQKPSESTTVTVGQKDQTPEFDTTVQPGPGESKVIPTKDGSKAPAGTTAKVIDGPGTATIDKDGNLVVTPNKDAKPGDKIKVQVTYPDGTTEIITITVGIDMGLCVGASAASAIPLLLLTPIALGLAMDNQQVKDMTAGFGKQLEDINTGIQKTLGIYNPALAQQFKVQVAPHLQNIALAAGFIASIGLLAGVAASQCTVPTEGGLSSDKNADQAKPTASAQPTTEVPTSEAPTSEAPTSEAPTSEPPAPEA
ncbi:Rib/alpha-like domain-containing protein [Corynebacterium pyruviciproducens]